MTKNKFTKAKQKWFKERLIRAQIDYRFRVLSPRTNKYLPKYNQEMVCTFYNSGLKAGFLTVKFNLIYVQTT